MKTERENNSNCQLENTKLPECDVRWLAANDVHTVGDLERLSLPEIQQFHGYKPCLLVPLYLLALHIGISIGGKTPDEMQEYAAQVLGHPVTPAATLERLRWFSQRASTLYADEVAKFLQ